MSRRVSCHKIPVEFGDYTLYIIRAPSEKEADNYIQKKFNVDTTYEGNNHEESSSYFIGDKDQLFIHIPPKLDLKYIVHEIEHIYEHMVNRMDTKQDEEGRAYLKQMLFDKIVNKLIQLKVIKITYIN